MSVKGVAFKKSFSYAGFEQQPKSFKNPKILCLNVELELKAEKDNAEVRVEQVSVTNTQTPLITGIPSYCGCRVADYFPETRGDRCDWSKSRSLKVTYRRSCNAIFCRPRYLLRWSCTLGRCGW